MGIPLKLTRRSAATWNEELAATNEEMAAINEELRTTNEELTQAQERLQNMIIELAESEDRFRNMAESSDVLIAVGDESSNATYFSRAWEKLTGRSAVELLAFGWVDLVHPEDKEPYVNIYLSAFEKRGPFTGEFRVLSSSGEYRWLLGKGSPRFRPDGSFAGYISSCIDITDRKSYEQQLEQIINILPAGVVVIRGNELIAESINHSNLAYWNKTREQVIGKPLLEILPELASQPFPAQLRNVMLTGEIVDVKDSPVLLTSPDGSIRESFVDYTYQPLTDSSGNRNGVLVMSSENTERVLSRKMLEEFSDEMQSINEELTASNEELAAVNEQLMEAQQKIEDGEAALRMAIDAAGLGTYYINATDRIFVASPQLKAFFGFHPDDEVPYEAAINQIHPDYRHQAADMVEAAFNSGARFDMEYPVIGHHDGKIRWVRGLGTVLRNNGKEYFTGVLHEITEQKADELRKNDFIGMVSHELKTPLTSLTAIIQVANSKLKISEDAFLAGAMEKANTQVKKMSTMINGFLNISRLESGKLLISKQPFQLEELLEEIIEETTITINSHEIRFEECDAVTINGDRDKIGSVVSNLISNAIKYSPKGKLVIVKCEIFDGLAQVSIKDEGMGIKAQDAEKLFDRYYRVEDGGNRHISGFGIGLYLSAEIINRHEGKIWVESEFGKGSTFYFKMPLNGV